MTVLLFASALLCGVPLGFIAGVVVAARIYQRYEKELQADWWMSEWRK